jgi:hypothetical protein
MNVKGSVLQRGRNGAKDTRVRRVASSIVIHEQQEMSMVTVTGRNTRHDTAG